MGTKQVKILVILLFGLQLGCEDKASQTRSDTPVVAVSPEVAVETTPSVQEEPPDEEPKIVTIQESSPDMRDALDQTAPSKPSKQGAAQVPRAEAGDAQIQGTLPKDLIRGVVRQHRGEMVACYEAELKNDPTLAGRIDVRFAISANGSVVSADVRESTLKNDVVENCMMNTVRRWVFPEPKGGVVIVNFPFIFNSADGHLND